jgi:hypothetical protein
MEGSQKPRTSRDRFKRLFKRPSHAPETAAAAAAILSPTTETQASQSTPTSSASTARLSDMEAQVAKPTSAAPEVNTPSPATESGISLATSTTPMATASTTVSGDTERTTERYQKASELLQDAVKGHEKWGAFEFPDINGEPKGFNDSQFKEKLDAVLQSRNQAMKHLSGWEKCGHAIQCAFAAFSPFAKNFLSIATQGQSVVTPSRTRSDCRLLYLIHMDCSAEGFCC